MTPEQQSSFRENGYLLLRRALSKNQVDPIKAHVLNELKRLNIWSSGKTLSASIKSMPAFQQITKISGSIKQDNLHSKVINKEILAAFSSLTPKNLSPVQGQFLISLPNQGDWSINGLNWHTDISASAGGHAPGIQAFILIDDMKPHGGATLALAGSHRMAGQEEPSRRLREILRRDGGMESELSRQNLSIVEMSGNAGDVYLMDMRLLHTPSINSISKVRIMATVRYLPVS
jgi:ectoine hydroxylase-related dioxygenase (phytanoyl-CoA dioxygenase family)